MSEKKKHDAAPQAQAEEKQKPDGAGQEAPVTEAQPAQEEQNGLELLQKQYDELNDKHLRILAEYDNYRKRSVREKESVYPQDVYKRQPSSRPRAGSAATARWSGTSPRGRPRPCP